MRRGVPARSHAVVRLEAGIVVVLICILIGVAIDRIMVVRFAAEQRALERTLLNLRTALTLELAGRLTRGERLPDLDGANAMAILSRHAGSPPNYRGEFAPDAAPVEPGTWYFDTANRLLVYRVLYLERGLGGSSHAATLRFRVTLGFDDDNGNGRFDSGEGLSGVRLEAIDGFGRSDTRGAEGVRRP